VLLSGCGRLLGGVRFLGALRLSAGLSWRALVGGLMWWPGCWLFCGRFCGCVMGVVVGLRAQIVVPCVGSFCLRCAALRGGSVFGGMCVRLRRGDVVGVVL